MYLMTSGSESNSISNGRCSSASGTRTNRSVCSRGCAMRPSLASSRAQERHPGVRPGREAGPVVPANPDRWLAQLIHRFGCQATAVSLSGASLSEDRTRVLVVDDEPNITELVSLGLRYEGF